MARKAPLKLVDSNGYWWAVLPGEVTDPAVLADAATAISGDGQALVVRIAHLHYLPRVKWCSRYDQACDFQGEWHSHWMSMHKGPGTAHTLARWDHQPDASDLERLLHCKSQAGLTERSV